MDLAFNILDLLDKILLILHRCYKSILHSIQVGWIVSGVIEGHLLHFLHPRRIIFDEGKSDLL